MGDYQTALEAAGARVIAFAEFGSYQGDWIARVDGGYVAGSYGSCSGCDAFEAEFGWGTDNCDDHRWSYRGEACVACDEAKVLYEQRLADFGRSYLDGITTAKNLREEFVRQSEWDLDAQDVVKWLDEQEADRG